MAKLRRSLIALAMVLALASVASLSAAEQSKPSQDKVAVVNGSAITRADFDRELMYAQERLSGTGMQLNTAQLTQLKKNVLEQLIERELLYQESQKKGIKVDQGAINEQWRTLKNRFPSEEDFSNTLKKMNLSEKAVKSQFKRNMAVQEFIGKEFAEKITVSDKEIKAYYDSNPAVFKQPEQVRASHILISVDPKGGPSRKAEALKKITNIRQKLQKGEDFSALARKFSQCPSSAQGGDLGYFTRGQMVKPFEEAAFALKSGEVSNIVETRFGYHLIKATDKKPESIISYKDVKDRLGQYLKEKKVQKEASLYVQKVKEKAKIERFLAEEK
ncbi:MAG: peptidylprolyl isomerase [Deltaproteobacteria bacterium]|nr:MAG: peptidylprolyl isomerase [Deltaproteobacteria bacterium]